MATYTVANITDITGNADWTFDGSNNQIGATGVGLSIGAPSGGPVADSVNVSGGYLINDVSVTAGLAPIASPTFTGTVTIPTLDVTAAATFATTLAVTGAVTLSDGLAVTGIVNATTGFEIGGNSIYTSPALTGIPTVPTAAAGTNSTQVASCAFVDNAVSSLTSNPNVNKLINPFVEIDQANEGASVSLTSGVPSYIVDGWKAEFAGAVGAVVSAQRVTDAPPGYSNSVKITVSTGGTFGAGSLLQFFQIVEADNLIDTAFGTASAQSLALTFWLKSSIAGVYSGAIINGAASRSYPFNITLSAANTWQKFTMSIPGDTGGSWVTSGNAAGLFFTVTGVAGSSFQGTANSWQFADVSGTSSNTNSLLSTSGATFQLGPAKLEVSTTATPLVRGSIQEDLAQCQRYYEKSYNLGVALATATGVGQLEWFGTSGNLAPATAAFKVTKRTTPTVSLWSPNTGTSGDIGSTIGDLGGSASSSGMGSVIIGPTSTLSSFALMSAHWAADARL